MSRRYNGAVHTGNAENFSRADKRGVLSLSAWRAGVCLACHGLFTPFTFCLCLCMLLGDSEQKCQMSHRLNWRSDKKKKYYAITYHVVNFITWDVQHFINAFSLCVIETPFCLFKQLLQEQRSAAEVNHSQFDLYARLDSPR